MVLIRLDYPNRLPCSPFVQQEAKSALGFLRDDGVTTFRIRDSLSFVRDSTVLPPEGPRVPDLGTRHPRTFPA